MKCQCKLLAGRKAFQFSSVYSCTHFFDSVQNIQRDNRVMLIGLVEINCINSGILFYFQRKLLQLGQSCFVFLKISLMWVPNKGTVLKLLSHWMDLFLEGTVLLQGETKRKKQYSYFFMVMCVSFRPILFILLLNKGTVLKLFFFFLQRDSLKT